jgi:hypothetical protein
MSMDVIPLWALFAGIVAVVIVSLECGYRLGCVAHKHSEEEKESPVSVISGSVLGLGAFILAFTFGIATNRFDARKELVRDDANAIRTVWQRSDFLPEPDRSETKALIRKYLDARVAVAQTKDAGLLPVGRFIREAEATQGRLWEIAVAHARNDMNSDVAALYVESLNELLAIQASRVAVGIHLRIPSGIWGILLALTSLGMLSLGYQTGIAGSKRSFSQPILALAFAMVIVLIVELDRPEGAFIRISQQPLIDVQSWISRSSSNSSRSGSGASRPLRSTSATAQSP